MRCLAIAALAVSACTPAPTELEPVSATAAPPSTYALGLDIAGMLDNGSSLSFRVTGATPGATVFIARSNRTVTGGSCPPPLGGLCLDLPRPALVMRLTADSTGVAVGTVTVPGFLRDGLVAWFQASHGGATPAVSRPVARFNPRDEGGIAMRIDTETALVGSSPPTYSGTQQNAWFSLYYPELDICTFEQSVTGAPTAVTTACPSCLFAFDVEYTDTIENSTTGDCSSTTGLTPSTVTSGTRSIGFTSTYLFDGYGPYQAALVYDAATTSWLPFAVDDDVSYSAGRFTWRATTPQFYTY